MRVFAIAINLIAKRIAIINTFVLSLMLSYIRATKSALFFSMSE